MAPGLVPELLSAFNERHPGVQVILLIEGRYSDLADGRVEVALRAGPPGAGSLIGRKLSDQGWAVYGSRAYVERHGGAGLAGRAERASPGRLRGGDRPDHARPLARGRGTGLHHRLSQPQHARPLDGGPSGYDLALLPCEIGDPEGGLCRVIDPLPDLTAGFWILTHPELHGRPEIRAFFDFMAEEIGRYRPLLLGRARAAWKTRDGTVSPEGRAREATLEGRPG